MKRVISFALLALAFLQDHARAAPPEILAGTDSMAFSNLERAPARLPDEIAARMRKTTWRPACPVPLENLRVLTIPYWNFSRTPATGTLIVHRDVADEVQLMFRKLYLHGFLIERMTPVEDYGGSDDRSMAANNTSAFNCRDVTGKPGRFSNHSWGRAVDINPLTNPMLLNGRFLPPEGSRYADRAKAFPGSILAGSFIVKLFQDEGWTWGGEWNDPDYQHFEKPDPSRDAGAAPKPR